MGFVSGGAVQSPIAEGIDAAMRGYQSARPGEMRGPRPPPTLLHPAGAAKHHHCFNSRPAAVMLAPPAVENFPGQEFNEGDIIGNPNLILEDRGFGSPPPAPPSGLQDPNPDINFTPPGPGAPTFAPAQPWNLPPLSKRLAARSAVKLQPDQHGRGAQWKKPGWEPNGTAGRSRCNTGQAGRGAL